ncbi:MAG: OmpA family protein, partial [Saprospiraceae bacterium]|nr:OmpA family protein [Saprospiraceae bacterium]
MKPLPPLFLAILILSCSLSLAQDVTIEGYAFESDNRGYLNEVRIKLHPKGQDVATKTVYSNLEGFFTITVPAGDVFTLTAEKNLFHPTIQDISTQQADKGKVFVKVQLNRKPGYLFDVTLAEERSDIDSVAQGITGAHIEIYNNTAKQPDMDLVEFPFPNFNFTFQRGNHYTILIRKKGFFSKRLEAYVNVENCILCFDGLASIESVTDNLTEGHQMGSLLANIELKKATIGSDFKIENILYDFNKSNIRTDAAMELNKLLGVLKDNPAIKVELGSHTDSRGRDEYNLDLSQKRAHEAVRYLVSKGVNPLRISARGYGESELTNRCANGVSCSEEQHQQNRRTVIKVLGYLDSDEMESKSLEDIKREEEFELMLEEVQNQEVIQVSSTDELPSEVRESLEAGQEVEKEILEEGDASKENIVYIDKAVVRDEKLSDPERMGAKRQELPDTVLEIRSAKQSSDTLLRTLPEDFTGFMIEVYRSVAKIGPGHQLHQTFVGLYEESISGHSHSYLIGSFKEIGDALIY